MQSKPPASRKAKETPHVCLCGWQQTCTSAEWLAHLESKHPELRVVKKKKEKEYVPIFLSKPDTDINVLNKSDTDINVGHKP